MDQGRERIGGRSRFSEPFGDVGSEIAYYAGDLLKTFSDDPEPLQGSGEMPDGDRAALQNWLNLEHLVPMTDKPLEVEVDVRQRTYSALFAFHAALPFSEPEREWLLSLYWQESGDDLPDRISVSEDQIMTAGVRRVVSGRELMRRWVAWRRENDEFSGQGGVDQAIAALYRIRILMR